ncbi:MAG: protein kinase [bacterium]|nr:protein kinase [bacterium]
MSRALCQLDDDGRLRKIVEIAKIWKRNDRNTPRRGETEDEDHVKLYWGTTKDATEPSDAMTGHYDVFLCYHGQARTAVEDVARRLRLRGLSPWLDVWELRPGRPWQRLVEEQIQKIGAAAVFVGEEGLGPWQDLEIAALLRQFVKRGCSVIPVILPECRKIPELPAFLESMTWVDLRRTTPDPLERLIWGITGERPALDSSPPEPSYLEEKTRVLSEALKDAYQRHEECVVAGRDTTAIKEEILELRRRLREGGRLKAGDFLGEGRFRLLDRLGSGGFATVWKAYDRRDRGLVALKVLHGQYAHDRSRRERFFRGARKMAELQHQGIVRVIETKLEEGGFHFFVMEYVEGGDLRRAILEGRLTSAAVLRVILPVGRALEYAHQHGVIHRDVKPANILLDGREKAKLTDFDLVRAFDTTGGTRSDERLGTLIYMAPEAMVRFKDSDVPADIYSLAMTALFMLNEAELSPSSHHDASSGISSLRWELREVLKRATALEPEARFPSVAEFLSALEPAYSHHQSLRQAAEQVSRQLAQGHVDEALSFLEQYAEQHPDSVEAFLEAGNLCLEANRPQEAVWRLQEACERAPGSAGMRRRLGEALLAAGEPREALEALRRAKELGEKSPELDEALAATYAQLGQTAQIRALELACRRFEEQLRGQPGDSEGLNKWGVALNQLADLAEGQRRKHLLEQACQRFQEALRCQPDMFRAHHNRGNALDNLADLEAGDERLRLRRQACRCYEETVQHNPRYPKALDNWSGVLIKMGTEASGERSTALWREAAERARQANGLKAHFGDFNLACAHSRLERFEEAARLVAEELLRSPEMRRHALEDPDLLPLWSARPELKDAIHQSLASSGHLASLEKWLLHR